MSEENDIISARLRKHAAEIERLQAAHQQERERLQWDIAHRNERLRLWRRIAWICVSAYAVLVGGGLVIIALLYCPDNAFSADPPPKMERLTVVTEGYVDKKGTWRSFDTGEPITVKAWKHQ